MPILIDSGEDPATLHELRFRISPEMIDEIIKHLREALPNEGCGLIGATRDATGMIVASIFFPGTNADDSQTRFTMEPAQVVAAFKAMRQLDLELGAIVHSHPVSDAKPSATDIREAYYPDALMLIVSFAQEPPGIRAWQIDRTGNEQLLLESQIDVKRATTAECTDA